MFHNNIVKKLEKKKKKKKKKKNEKPKLVENLPPIYRPYRFLHNLCSFLLRETVKVFDLF